MDTLEPGVEAQNDAVLEVRNASVTFDMDRGTSRVLDNVTIDIDRNETLGIVGESGSGKSMFASALLDAIVDPGRLSGDIYYTPEDEETVNIPELSDEARRRLRWEEIAMVFQGAMSSFNPTMKIRGHFVETIEAHDGSVDAQMEHVNELFEDLYLEPERVLDSYPHELSGGMKQRALIALSLVLNPSVLVMDEPTAALDLLMQQSILTLLDGLQEKYDLTVVFITHDLPLVADIADRVGVLYAFEFVEIGKSDELLLHPAHPYTRSLIKAVPTLDTAIDEMRPIKGSAPDPVDVPEGCSYRPRCPLADEQCRQVDPAYRDVSDVQEVACHHWERSADRIPLSFDAVEEAKR